MARIYTTWFACLCMFLLGTTPAMSASGIDTDIDAVVMHAELIVKQADDLETKQNDATIDKKLVKQAEGMLEAALDRFSLFPSERAVASARLIKKLAEDMRTQNDSDKKSTLKSTLKEELQRVINNLKTSQSQEEVQKIADSRFAGFRFGVAIGAVFKAGQRDLVRSPSLDANRIVRIDRDNNGQANFLLETHYFFVPNAQFMNIDLLGFSKLNPKDFFDLKKGDWGHGPFVAVQPGTENIIESIGLGWMIGFKRAKIVGASIGKELGDSFNLGVGIMVNPNAKVLGDGIMANQPLPVGETSIRLKTTTEIGYLVTFSYSF